MFFTHTRRIIRSGFFNFMRNGFVSLSSVLIMTVTLATITAVVFVSALLNASLDHIREKVDVNVYFVTTAAEGDILKLKKQIEALPEVEKVGYVSREDALAAFRERHANDEYTIQALDELGENPLGAVLNVKAKEPSQYEGIAAFLDKGSFKGENGAPIIDKVNYFQNKEAIDTLTRIISSSEKLGFIFAIALVILSILITFNTIRLVIYISREEISVMQLVGAGTIYIRGPFVISGILYGFVSGLLTLALFYPVTFWLGRVTDNFFVGINIFDYYVSNFAQIFAIVVGSGIAIGAVSSFLAVRKYLRA